MKFSAQPSTLSRNPLDLIDHDHVVQVQMCDAMEQIADGLPDDIDSRRCARVAAWLQYGVPIHHRDEVVGLFPLLRGRATEADAIGPILDRLAEEHESDTDFAAEIVETLDAMARHGRVANPEMLGYMLRGFFERYRRHVHWENTLVMPLVRRRLTEDDLANLAAIMASNRAAVL